MTNQTHKNDVEHLLNFEEIRIERFIRPTKTRKEIAAEYGIDPHTLKNWIKRSSLSIPSGDLNPKSQRLLYITFGVPPQSEC